jgi:hypothetical protein
MREEPSVLEHSWRPQEGRAVEYFLTAAGLIWIFCGALVLSLSTTTSPELVACLAFSFGVMFIGLAALLARLRTFSATSHVAQVSVFPPQMQVLAPPALPPPVPMDYAIPIEDAINGVRSAARPAWIRSLEEITGTAIVDPAPVHEAHPPQLAYAAPAYPAPAYPAPAYPAPTFAAPVYPTPAYPAQSAPAYPAPAQYFRSEAFQAPTDLVEIGGEYYVDPTQHSQEATALRRLQQIFSN